MKFGLAERCSSLKNIREEDKQTILLSCFSILYHFDNWLRYHNLQLLYNSVSFRIQPARTEHAFLLVGKTGRNYARSDASRTRWVKVRAERICCPKSFAFSAYVLYFSVQLWWLQLIERRVFRAMLKRKCRRRLASNSCYWFSVLTSSFNIRWGRKIREWGSDEIVISDRISNGCSCIRART